jgi:hypothetical protein
MLAVSNPQLWSHILIAALQHFNGNIIINIQKVMQEKDILKNFSAMQP